MDAEKSRKATRLPESNLFGESSDSFEAQWRTERSAGRSSSQAGFSNRLNQSQLLSYPTCLFFSIPLFLFLFSVTLSHHRSCTHRRSYRYCRCYSYLQPPVMWSCIPLGAITRSFPLKISSDSPKYIHRGWTNQQRFPLIVTLFSSIPSSDISNISNKSRFFLF